MTKKFHFSSISIAVMFVAAFFVTTLGVVASAYANSTDLKSGQRLVTIHDRGVEKSVITGQTTLRGVFEEANILIDPNDMVEPGLDEPLASDNYQVNVYRARPVTVIDGSNKIRVMSAYQTPKQIAAHAGFSLQDEDIATMTLPGDPLADDMNLQLEIDRATPVRLVLYGNQEVVYTQAESVAEFLKEKDIALQPKDTITVKSDQQITTNMKIEIWRNGNQVITRKEKVEFATKQIQDADRKVGYRKIVTAGIPGKKIVTYKATFRNGKIVKKKAIRTVIIKKSVQQVEIVGSKPSFSGGFGAALAKLRACESGGNYANKNNSLYRGAYQFGYQTWGNRYGIYDPADATPAQQDAAARELYERRGWQPWPHCGASLPDIYR